MYFVEAGQKEAERTELDAPVASRPKPPWTTLLPRKKHVKFLALQPLLKLLFSLPKANYAFFFGVGEGEGKWTENSLTMAGWSWFFLVVVSNIFYVHPYLGKISNLTFQMSWNRQPVLVICLASPWCVRHKLAGCLRTVSLPDEDEFESVQQGSMTKWCEGCPKE